MQSGCANTSLWINKAPDFCNGLWKNSSPWQSQSYTCNHQFDRFVSTSLIVSNPLLPHRTAPAPLSPRRTGLFMCVTIACSCHLSECACPSLVRQLPVLNLLLESSYSVLDVRTLPTFVVQLHKRDAASCKCNNRSLGNAKPSTNETHAIAFWRKSAGVVVADIRTDNNSKKDKKKKELHDFHEGRPLVLLITHLLFSFPMLYCRGFSTNARTSLVLIHAWQTHKVFQSRSSRRALLRSSHTKIYSAVHNFAFGHFFLFACTPAWAEFECCLFPGVHCYCLCVVHGLLLARFVASGKNAVQRMRSVCCFVCTIHSSGSEPFS